jgi:hypothetical protein
MTIRTTLKSASKNLVTEWNTASRSVTEWNTGLRSTNPRPSVQQVMHLACLRQAGGHHGSRAGAALGIQERSRTLYVLINYSPMQKQCAYTKKNIRLLIDPPCNCSSCMNWFTLYKNLSLIHKSCWEFHFCLGVPWGNALTCLITYWIIFSLLIF